MKKNVVSVMRVLGIFLATSVLLVSCNFPLFGGGQEEPTGMESTMVALELTSSVLQTAVASTAENSQSAIPSMPAPANTDVVGTTEVPTEEIVHQMTPFNPPGNRESGMVDPDTSAYASEKKSVAGENFSEGILERPFNADTMDKYFPDLDVIEGSLNRSDPWIFVKLKVHGTATDGSLSGSYGAEFDLNVDGRGDVLVFVTQPGIEWSVAGVQVWKDTNQDVGGSAPFKADQVSTGNGYDSNLFDSGQGDDPDAAWARVDPSDPRVVWLAFKNSLIQNDQAFIWGVWTHTEFNPGKFDYNDHFTIAEAGSPLTYQVPYYPLKGLAEVDNTCRWSVGFIPNGSEPGICTVPATPTPTQKPTVLVPGSIFGYAFWDANRDMVRQAPGEVGIANIPITVYKGACGSGGAEIKSTTTASDGRYSVSGLNPGHYCVKASSIHGYGYSGIGPKNVTISGGDSVQADFPFEIIIY